MASIIIFLSINNTFYKEKLKGSRLLTKDEIIKIVFYVFMFNIVCVPQDFINFENMGGSIVGKTIVAALTMALYYTTVRPLYITM